MNSPSSKTSPRNEDLHEPLSPIPQPQVLSPSLQNPSPAPSPSRNISVPSPLSGSLPPRVIDAQGFFASQTCCPYVTKGGKGLPCRYKKLHNESGLCTKHHRQILDKKMSEQRSPSVSVPKRDSLDDLVLKPPSGAPAPRSFLSSEMQRPSAPKAFPTIIREVPPDDGSSSSEDEQADISKPRFLPPRSSLKAPSTVSLPQPVIGNDEPDSDDSNILDASDSETDSDSDSYVKPETISLGKECITAISWQFYLYLLDILGNRINYAELSIDAANDPFIKHYFPLIVADTLKRFGWDPDDMGPAVGFLLANAMLIGKHKFSSSINRY